MAIAPISGVATGVSPVTTTGTKAAGGGGPLVDFGAGLDAVSKATQRADTLGQQVATGQLQNVHQFMAASSKASLAVELTVAIRNKAVEAYQEIMRMQV